MMTVWEILEMFFRICSLFTVVGYKATGSPALCTLFNTYLWFFPHGLPLKSTNCTLEMSLKGIPYIFAVRNILCLFHDLEKKILKNVQCILTLLLLSPLGEGLSSLFEQT
jgi:hypothetical protein